MKKTILFFLFFLTGCASTAVKNPYTDEQTVYKIDEVNVEFSSACTIGDYDGKEEIADLFDEQIRQGFCSKMTCVADGEKDNGNLVTVTFNISYRRVLMGEAFNCLSQAYGNGFFKYGIKAVKKVKNENGKKELATVAAMASAQENFVNKGFSGNFKAIFEQYSFSGGREEEQEEIKSISDVLVRKTVEKLR